MQITSYLSSADGTIDTCNETFQDTEYEAMTDQSSKLASFNGERKEWKTWKKQRNGYKIINEGQFEGYAGIPDPRKRGRVTQQHRG